MNPGNKLGPRGVEVSRMFGRIARRYDFANRILSLGLCVGWRDALVAETAALRPRRAVDLATGSGDVAFELLRSLPPDTEVVGYDFCEPMLDVARERARQSGRQAPEFKLGDCMALPIADDAVDAVSIAYGVRNFEDRARGLRELRRVVKPGGSVFILEFSKPAAWFAPFHFVHVRLISPILAGLLTGDFGTYRYLGTSIAGFPDADGLTQELKNAGFSEVSHESMMFGTVALHRAKK